jgi:hypothetical protein
MDKYSEAVLKIVSEQELIIGPLAKDLAKKANGITFKDSKEVMITGDPKSALENLVGQYHMLFGKTSVEVSKNAIKSLRHLLSSEDLPEILK